ATPLLPALHKATPLPPALHETIPLPPALHKATPLSPTLHKATPLSPTLRKATPLSPTLRKATPLSPTLRKNHSPTATAPASTATAPASTATAPVSTANNSRQYCQQLPSGLPKILIAFCVIAGQLFTERDGCDGNATPPSVPKNCCQHCTRATPLSPPAQH
ncbi:hypothetical protein BIW11_04749, partial [Tropilaelaps mercedesae]